MRWHDPHWLLLIPGLLAWWWLLRRAERRRTCHVIPDGEQLAALPGTMRARCARHLVVLRLLILCLVAAALARPQSIEREVRAASEGADLVVAVDVSTSMLAEDPTSAPPRKNRLAIARDVLAEFVRGRPGDRIGLIAFAARPYAAAPLTRDHEWLVSVIGRLDAGMIEDGTAVGDALLAALDHLHRRAPGATGSQAAILVTDGRGNTGATSPQLAAAAARTLGIRVHAIGIGARGTAVLPVLDPLGRTVYRQMEADLDEAVLNAIAQTTGGSYHRADDGAGLARVFEAIDRLEKRSTTEKHSFVYGELYPSLAIAALALLFLEIVLGATLLRTAP